MTLARFIEKNIWAILATAWAALLAYVTGTTRTQVTLADLEKRTVVLEARVKADTQFRFCATRHIDALEGGGKMPSCELRGE